jgi:RNA 3'-terminal phosphate cyclase (ATP)
MAVQAAKRIGHADVVGAALNSTELTFRPRTVEAGEYTFDIGSAGSTTLVFQTVLPALLLADGPSLLRLSGGTHNHGGPPWDFLNQVFLPAIGRMGAKVNSILKRHGFAPGGGGEWTASIQTSRLHGFDLHQRGPLQRKRVRALVSNLPAAIAEREVKTIAQTLSWPASTEVVDALGPGNIVMISAEYANVSELATGFGQRGLATEVVAKIAVDCWQRYERTEAPVGEHLADQLLLPMAIAGSGSFSTIEPTLHTLTNAEVIAKFLPRNFRIEPEPRGVCRISL